MSNDGHVADISAQTYPEYEDRTSIQQSYLPEYDPVSLHAPHSSLLRTSTWVGMGVLMAALIGVGTIIYGIGIGLWGTGTVEVDHNIFIIIGAVILVVLLVVATILIRRGRRYYRQYRKETGRMN